MTQTSRGSARAGRGRQMTTTSGRKRSYSSSISSSQTSSPNQFSGASSSDSGSWSLTPVETRSSRGGRRKRQIPAPTGSNNDTTSTPVDDVTTDATATAASTATTTTPALVPPGVIAQRLTAQRNVPAFLNKLYSMVDDPSTNDLIRWSKDGASFIVERHEEFARTVLPRFYKHNTFASFVRQLNMYDFHKVPHLQQGVLISDTKHEIWEFSNPHFQRGRPDMLVLVSRKRSRDRDEEPENISLASIVKDITAIRKHQATISTDLKNLHQDNEILWQETLSAREKYQRHQEVMAKILQFLTAVFSDDRNNNQLGMSKQKSILSEESKECSTLSNDQPGSSNTTTTTAATTTMMHDSTVAAGVADVPRKLIEEAASLAGVGTSSSFSQDNNSNNNDDKKGKMGMSTTPYSASKALGALYDALRTNLRLRMPNSRYPTEASTAGLEASTSAAGAYSQGAGPVPYSVLSSTDAPAVSNQSTVLNNSEDVHHPPPTDIPGHITAYSQTLDTASRSVQAISEDIDTLQSNVEALASNLGLKPSQFSAEFFDNHLSEFAANYSMMISSASAHDKSKLFELANNPYMKSFYDSVMEDEVVSASSLQERGKVVVPGSSSSSMATMPPMVGENGQGTTVQENASPSAPPSMQQQQRDCMLGVSLTLVDYLERFLRHQNADGYQHHLVRRLQHQQQEPVVTTTATGGMAAAAAQEPVNKRPSPLAARRASKSNTVPPSVLRQSLGGGSTMSNQPPATYDSVYMAPHQQQAPAGTSGEPTMVPVLVPVPVPMAQYVMDPHQLSFASPQDPYTAVPLAQVYGIAQNQPTPFGMDGSNASSSTNIAPPPSSNLTDSETAKHKNTQK